MLFHYIKNKDQDLHGDVYKNFDERLGSWSIAECKKSRYNHDKYLYKGSALQKFFRVKEDNNVSYSDCNQMYLLSWSHSAHFYAAAMYAFCKESADGTCVKRAPSFLFAYPGSDR